ncbi:hypothetical protein EDB80DRAFT_155551 [Ilyonectria destructans]|nr:hypothetical protein EDB80DRAFT_155551 [Ilyonectria destructans]
MVNFIALSIAILAVIVPLAMADNCRTGVIYCGSTLQRRGNYYQQIHDALEESGQVADEAHVNDSLFYCSGGSNGDIVYQTYCDGCQDGGDGNNDYCP